MKTVNYPRNQKTFNKQRTFGVSKAVGNFIILFSLATVLAYSQETTKKGFGKNEIKMNMFYLPGGHLELSYERVLGNRSAIGATVGYLISSEKSNYTTDILTYDFGVLPYYRYYLGKKRAAGFFLESNMLVFYREDGISDETEWGLGLGFAVGVKFMHKRNWCLGLVLGGGGMFQAHSDSDDAQAAYVDLNFPSMYPRLGITIGRRF